LPIRTINVGFPLCIATTGLAAKISLADGGELRRPQPRFLPDYRGGLCRNWRQRLALSAHFDGREDWCRVSSAEGPSETL
jgi:hypothetical protein